MADVYRAPMRSRSDDVPATAGVQRGLAHGLCGIGGPLPRDPEDLVDAVFQTADVYGERAADRLSRWAAVPEGATMWTRDADGRFHRGTLTGPWRYDSSPAAREADLVHVRLCHWDLAEPDAVPPAVQEAFRRGGRNFQRISAL